MSETCHRCGTALGVPDTFCPNCGAPQLRYEAGAETGQVEGGTPVEGRGIQWKAALGAAVTIAVPVGLFSSGIVPLLSAGSWIWVIGGAIAAVGLYQRRSAQKALDRRTGMRIGGLIGLMAATVTTALNAGAMIYERYVLRGGEAMEKAFEASMVEGSQLAQQFYKASPAQAAESMRFWLTPDGRAAFALATALTSALVIVMFSAFGGVLGARIFSRRGEA